MNDEDDPGPEPRFSLEDSDLPLIGEIVALVRGRLATMRPRHIRAAAGLLLALERLPGTTEGQYVSFAFVAPRGDGDYGWVDIVVSPSEFRLGVGEHSHDPGVGGDTETRVLFEADAEDEWRNGDIGEWLEVARPIAADGEISAEYEPDQDGIDWTVGEARS